jgi:hypothetical protein
LASAVALRYRGAAPFPGSSVVEQPAVNRLVAGSNPARGASAFFVRCGAILRIHVKRSCATPHFLQPTGTEKEVANRV